MKTKQNKTKQKKESKKERKKERKKENDEMEKENKCGSFVGILRDLDEFIMKFRIVCHCPRIVSGGIKDARLLMNEFVCYCMENELEANLKGRG